MTRPTTPASPNAIEDELLAELALQTSEEIKLARAHERLAIRVKVKLLPGNASDVVRGPIAGTTLDLSEGGCRAVFNRAPAVGDLYRARFDYPGIANTTVFVRCVRCRLLDEESFESGFMFFQPIDLSGGTKRGESKELLD